MHLDPRFSFNVQIKEFSIYTCRKRECMKLTRRKYFNSLYLMNELRRTWKSGLFFMNVVFLQFLPNERTILT